MTIPENYRSKQAILNIAIFVLLALAMLNGNWLVSVGGVLAATALALFSSTTQPKPPADEQGHH